MQCSNLLVEIGAGLESFGRRERGAGITIPDVRLSFSFAKGLFLLRFATTSFLFLRRSEDIRSLRSNLSQRGGHVCSGRNHIGCSALRIRCHLSLLPPRIEQLDSDVLLHLVLWDLLTTNPACRCRDFLWSLCFGNVIFANLQGFGTSSQRNCPL